MQTLVLFGLNASNPKEEKPNNVEFGDKYRLMKKNSAKIQTRVLSMDPY